MASSRGPGGRMVVTDLAGIGINMRDTGPFTANDGDFVQGDTENDGTNFRVEGAYTTSEARFAFGEGLVDGNSLIFETFILSGSPIDLIPTETAQDGMDQLIWLIDGIATRFSLSPSGDGDFSTFDLSGNEMLEGAGFSDTLFGGAGSDTLMGGGGDDDLSGDRGADRIVGGGGDDLIAGGGGFDTLRGAAGADTVDGGGGKDRLVGGGGNDLVSGGRGNDTVIGGPGNDTLSGGKGADELKGGGGRDTFQFAAGDRSDTILRYQQGKDRIEFTSGADDFSDLSIVQQGADVLIRHVRGSILVTNQDADDFTAGDFLFS